MSSASELAHLFRVLKAPAAARALPGLADRAREESWTHEKFLEALLSAEATARDSHGGENRIRVCPLLLCQAKIVICVGLVRCMA